MNIFDNLSLFELMGVLILSLVPIIILLTLVLYSDRKSREPFYLILIWIFYYKFINNTWKIITSTT